MIMEFQPGKKQDKLENVTPEDIGFSSIEGMDVFTGQKESGSRIGETTIDNTEGRKSRFERALLAVQPLAGDRNVLQNLSNAIQQITTEGSFEEHNTELLDFLEFAKSALAALKDKTNLRLIFERSVRENLQSSIVVAQTYIDLLPSEINQSTKNALRGLAEIAMELYAQKNGGKAFRTSDQKRELEEMKKRAGNMTVT